MRSLLRVLFSALVLCSAVLPAQAEQTTFQTLTTYLAANDLDLPDILTDSAGNPDWFIKPPAFIPNAADYFVIDVRADSVYEKGHIPGAVRSSFRNVLTTAKQAGDKPIVVVCHTGQGAAFAIVALRLSGYDDAKVLVFGMSVWGSEFDAWSAHTSDTAVGHTNWTTDAAASPESFGDPTITSAQTEGSTILGERVQALLEGGPRMVAGPRVLNAPEDYFVNVYWPSDTLAKYGHIAGAYNIVGTLSIAGGGLGNLDPSRTIVTYCYTGQAAAVVTAYLTVLGFDARFMAFGANGMIHSELESSKWAAPAQDHEYDSGSPHDMLAAYLDNHHLDITDIFFSAPGQPSWIIPASMVNEDPAAYYIMDIRPDSVYDKGHIQGAVNVKLPFVLDSAANAGTKPIVVACHTGQGAAYAVTALRLSGYPAAKSMKWGMSSWNGDFDIWTSHTSDTGDDHANWSSDAAAALDTFDHPEFSTLSDDSAAVLKERVAAMLHAGPGKLPPVMALASLDSYQINVYWPPDSVAKYGHVAGAYNIVGGNLSIGTGGLVHLDPGRTVVTYCWTGQMAAALSAYLAVLGYDTKFIVFGANGMIYSQLPDGPYKWPGAADYAFADGSEAATTSYGRPVCTPITLRGAGQSCILVSTQHSGKHTVKVLRLDGTTVISRELDGGGRHGLRFDTMADGIYMIRLSGARGTVVRHVMIRR